MKCFIIMPFAKEFADVYAVIRSAVTTGISGETVTCRRLDEIRGAGRISDDLVRELSEATVCIADITGCNPNVMWEVGYALALQKPTLLLTQDISHLPFDIKDMRTIAYERESLHSSLHDQLATAFRDTLGRFEVRREAAAVSLPSKRAPITIGVTGSMQLDRAKASRRLESLLQPYLDSDATWFCGSYGDADEAALEYLIEQQQRVMAVGYHAYDISARVLKLIEASKIPFVDAHKEQLPKGLDAPNKRDLLFLTRADLLILLWNGGSTGTGKLIRFYEEQGRDHLVSFV